MNTLKNLTRLWPLIKLKLTLGLQKSPDAATFGVMPNYGFTGRGMSMDSISPGKTAEQHGFISGDIITRIDQLEVIDLVNYMSVLSNYHVGDTAEVTFLRGQDELQKKVQFR